MREPGYPACPACGCSRCGLDWDEPCDDCGADYPPPRLPIWGHRLLANVAIAGGLQLAWREGYDASACMDHPVRTWYPGRGVALTPSPATSPATGPARPASSEPRRPGR